MSDQNELKIFENYTGAAILKVATTITALDKASGGVQKALTIAFASILAADHGQSPVTASKLLADKVPGCTKSSANVMRTRSRKAFEEEGRVQDLRRAVGEPGAVSPADFEKAIAAYCKGFDVRKMEDARKAQKALEAASAKAALAANPPLMSTDIEDATATPPPAPATPVDPLAEVFAAQTDAAQAIQNLITMTQWENQDQAQAAKIAILALAEQIAAAMGGTVEISNGEERKAA